MTFGESESIKILLIEDDEDDYVLTRNMLQKNESFAFDLDWIAGYENGREIMLRDEHHIYLIDYQLGAKSGIELLSEVKSQGLEKPVVILTGQGNHQIDIDAMRAGAADYLIKGEIDTRILERTIRYNVERYRQTQLLVSQQRKYHTLFERSLDAIFIANSEHQFVDFNNSFLDQFGFSREEGLMMNLKNLFRDELDFDQFQRLMAEGKTVKNMEVVLQDKGGKERICLLSAASLQDDQPHQVYQGIIKDITQLKQTEQDLRNSERLALTGQMVNTLAHEIRNPLASITLTLNQLQKEFEDNEKVTMYAGMAKKNCDQINNLITEMLNSSKPYELKLSKTSINNVLDEALEDVHERIVLNKVELQKNFDDAVPPFLLDAHQLKRAFINILVNAVEAMEGKSGRLSVETKRRDGNCTVYISDTGQGIPKEKVQKLFDPFFTGKKSGMGLGLTTVYNIIKSHNGQIEIDSTVGKGTTFACEFPITDN